MVIKVENNFLDNDFFWELCKLISDFSFPWYPDTHNDLVHNLIYKSELQKENSFYAPKILDPLIVKLNAKKVLSSKLILNFISCGIEYLPIMEEKIDVNNKAIRGFLCINTCNSEIDIVGVNKIPNVENRFICFPKNNPYRATTHTDKRSRIMLEIVYEI